MDRPNKANCTSGSHEPHGYQGLPKGSVRTGYEGNQRSVTAVGLMKPGGTNVALPYCRLFEGTSPKWKQFLVKRLTVIDAGDVVTDLVLTCYLVETHKRVFFRGRELLVSRMGTTYDLDSNRTTN